MGGATPIRAEKSLPVNVTPHVSNVLVAGHSGPVLGEDASAPFVLLALEDDSMAGSLEAEIEAADAAEERADIQLAAPVTVSMIEQCCSSSSSVET